MGRTNIGNRPFSTQGYNEDFELNASVVNPQRHSTLEPVQHIQKGKKGRQIKVSKQVWNTLTKSPRRAGANKSVDNTAMSSIISDIDRRRATAGNDPRKGSIDDEGDVTTQATPLAMNSLEPSPAYANEKVTTQGFSADFTAWESAAGRDSA